MEDELRSAIREGNLPRVKLLMEGGASLAAPGRICYTTLAYAALFGKLSTVKWLVQEFGTPVSEVDGYGYTALLHAANSSQI
jgi:ankyrin repeat protein